jgi:Amt family ammonium transporter
MFKKIIILSFLSLLMLVLPAVSTLESSPLYAAERVADPAGTATGTAIDVTAAKPGQPTLDEVATQAGHNKVSINMVWLLICGFLVMFMQAGFALVESGLTRAKNAAHTMSMNMMVYALGMIGFFISGFAIMFGGIGALGTLGGFGGLASEFSINLVCLE